VATSGNIDRDTVEGFGQEWSRFDQRDLPAAELQALFEQYFSAFPWERLPPDAQGFDLGCGSGRWARAVAPRVGRLHCIDAAAPALEVARRALAGQTNCTFHHASVEAIPLEDASMDFGYSLGVLHHVPDTLAGLRACARKLKPGAPFLVYLYYAFDNRPAWFRALWRASDLGRRVLSRLPFRLRAFACDAIALTVYLPLARMARLAERAGRRVDAWPLSAYRNLSFYVMRTDALDRFGTRLEQRFTRAQIQALLQQAGFTDIGFRDSEPYWCAVGIRGG
jgi:ubiquinone/menaquinone biosynthesis C-methylase UbiE